MRLPTLYLALIFLLTSVFCHFAHAREQRPPRKDRVVIQVIQLDHADAENLATVLAPLLSPEGRIVAYSRTNSLLIKDRASVVQKLVEVIKGPPDPQP
jgi:type II secretory pathway component GspD/PulD (secretin)